VSVACLEATDGRVQLGSQRCVTKLLKDVRLKEIPQGRKHDMHVAGVGDVVLLLQEAYLFGPNEALGLGHLKEKMILCLMVDTAARPSDLHRLYRILDGRNCQIRFFTREGAEGMEVRYFWSKEIDPFSSRSNSTSVWFTTWVTVWCSNPKEICSHCVMQDFLKRSSDPAVFATTRVKQLGIEVQPLIWAKRTGGKFQHCSVDHISNIVKRGLQAVGLGYMTCQSIRGASTSKIGQCAPQLRSEMLKLGRWTTEETFRGSYESEVKRVPKRDDESAKSQQVLRWGFNPKMPHGMTRDDYVRPPAHWVGRTFAVGKVVKFEDGVYFVSKKRSTSRFFHWELMESILNS